MNFIVYCLSLLLGGQFQEHTLFVYFDHCFVHGSYKSIPCRYHAFILMNKHIFSIYQDLKILAHLIPTTEWGRYYYYFYFYRQGN